MTPSQLRGKLAFSQPSRSTAASVTRTRPQSTAVTRRGRPEAAERGAAARAQPHPGPLSSLLSPPQVAPLAKAHRQAQSHGTAKATAEGPDPHPVARRPPATHLSAPAQQTAASPGRRIQTQAARPPRLLIGRRPRDASSATAPTVSARGRVAVWLWPVLGPGWLRWRPWGRARTVCVVSALGLGPTRRTEAIGACYRWGWGVGSGWSPRRCEAEVRAPSQLRRERGASRLSRPLRGRAGGLGGG